MALASALWRGAFDSRLVGGGDIACVLLVWFAETESMGMFCVRENPTFLERVSDLAARP